MSKIKSVRAVVKHPQKREQIIFRALVTILEVLAAVLVAIPPELMPPDKVAIAAAIGGLISIVINVLKESGVLSNGA